MALVRFTCDSSYSAGSSKKNPLRTADSRSESSDSHDDVLVEVPGAMQHACAKLVTVPCPECNVEMDYTLV